MTLTPDTAESLESMAALANTAREDPDVLLDPGAFEDFVGRWKWTGERRRDEAERRAVRALRPSLQRFWAPDADEQDLVDTANELLRRGHALPQLVRHDGWDYHLHATPSDAPFATRWMVEVAMAVVDVIRAGETWRFKVCAADDCGSVLVDLSRNRSRRFCDFGCGNRANVAAYRARRSEV